MDFSDDPDFPAATAPAPGSLSAHGAAAVAAARSTGPSTGKAVPGAMPTSPHGAATATMTAVMSNKAANGASGSGGLVIRNKRLSISSGRSIGSSPLSTSPRAIGPSGLSAANGVPNTSTAGGSTSAQTGAASAAPSDPAVQKVSTGQLEKAGTSNLAVPAATGPSDAGANANGPSKAFPASSVRSMPAALSITASPPRTTSHASTGKIPSAPAVPVRPPNVITPSFDDTFRRPPRSLLPYDEEQALMKMKGGLGGRGRGGAGAGAGAKATGESGTMGKMAWKAWGTASYYMYGATPDAPSGTGTPSNQSASVTQSSNGAESDADSVPQETRGLAAARHVGASLPRLLGLHHSALSPPSASSLQTGADPDSYSDSGYVNVRRVVVVGVHGWFPAKMLNSVIGEPTGTSQKFSSMMAAAVRQFFRDKGYDEEEVQELRVTEVPLEGEGTIEHRVDK